MGFFDPFKDGISIASGSFSRPSQHHRRNSSRLGDLEKPPRPGSGSGSPSRPHRRTRSAAASTSAASFFGLGGGSGNHSRGSFFGWGRPSYYKRSPRQGFLQRAFKKLKRLLRDLLRYAKRHPWRVFLLAIVPLITGGALTALLAPFGLRVPPTLERFVGLASRAAAGDHAGLVSDAVGMVNHFGQFGWPSMPDGFQRLSSVFS